MFHAIKLSYDTKSRAKNAKNLLKSRAKNAKNLLKSRAKNAKNLLKSRAKKCILWYDKYIMYRFAINSLIKWKNSQNHKPLILEGARQVGKTWLMKEFGKTQYKKVAYISFDNNPSLCAAFEEDLNINRLIEALNIEAGFKITPNDTLIIFDEIQECPLAITSLKYFNENAPQYDIIAAGSLLGVAYHKGTGFPVGKVEFLKLNPLNFQEFLLAYGEDMLYRAIQRNNFETLKLFRNKLIDLLRRYCYIGGMPKIVESFCKNRDFNQVRKLQKDILKSYDNDFSKHVPNNYIERTRLLWNAIPSQLIKENKKCVYGKIKEGARAKDFEISLNWLINSGLVNKISKVTEPKMPLKAYEEPSSYKLFLLDVGLLGAMTDLDVKSLLKNDKLFNDYNGALTEQYVLQELKSAGNFPIFYWTNNKSEIDFILQYKDKIIPIEAKATINLQAKSLKVYMEKYNPEIAIRTSLSDYKVNKSLYDIPLYAIGNMENTLNYLEPFQLKLFENI